MTSPTSTLTQMPEKLRPYHFHGLRFDVKGLNAYADCPFCTREGKFAVKVEDGRWRCVVCNEGAEKGTAGEGDGRLNQYFKGGNVYTFVRLLWEKSRPTPEDLDALKAHRNLLFASTLSSWGVRKSLVNGNWLLPGYSADGKLMTLYRYVKTKEGWKVLATPELGHHLYGVQLFDKSKPTVYVCEGPWDAMCLWETLRVARHNEDGGLSPTRNPKDNALSNVNVVAVPSCSVFNDKWRPLFDGKHVVLMYDNDHPKTHPDTQQEIPPAGYDGMRRVAVSLSSQAEHRPSTISALLWGGTRESEDGNDSTPTHRDHDPDLPSGTDVRDVITRGEGHDGRVEMLAVLLALVKPMPEGWVSGRGGEESKNGQAGLKTSPCVSWAELLPHWRRALKWTKGLNRALACMLSSVASTMTLGDQLWLKIISPPSGGKTTIAEAISVARQFVTAKSTIRGFHSGYKSDSEGKEDNSLIPQIMGMTLITKDGDTLLTSPNIEQILAEGRDLYDTTARTHYRNKTAKDYAGVRFTWLLCGTSALRQIDRSELGQRFLDVVIMEDIDDELEDEILDRKGHQAERASKHETNGKPETHNDPDMVEAMKHTGGYVEYLRKNVHELIKNVSIKDKHFDYVKSYAKYVAYLRARPSIKQTEGSGRELAGRLMSQLIRLTQHLCVVLNKTETDDEVMEIVRQVALDTARGVTYEMCRVLHRKGAKGAELQSLTDCVHDAGHRDKATNLVKLLVRIKAIETFSYQPIPTLAGQTRYRLTQRMKTLFEETHEVWQEN